METGVTALPDDALADVLRRLPAQSLATAACVCRAWHAIIDGHALLLSKRRSLPRSVHGIFINYIDYDPSHLLARPSSPSTIPGVDGSLRFLPIDHTLYRSSFSVMDHCNGLLLCEISGRDLCVCNPATRRYTLIPRQNVTRRYRHCPYTAGAYLTYDPARSPHYEVFLIPAVPKAPHSDPWTQVNEGKELHSDPCRLTEWPPTPWMLHVFSSRTGQWEERAFVREGGPAGTVEDMRPYPSQLTFEGLRQRYAVYLQGHLYVHCHSSFVVRLSLSKDRYQVTKTPAYFEKRTFGKPYLGRSKKEVLFGIVQRCRLRVWILNESDGQMQWILKYQDDLNLYAQHVAEYGRNMDAPWILDDAPDADAAAKTLSERSVEWDSDNDDVFSTSGGAEEYCAAEFDVLGFHPYKEIVYLAEFFRVVAYHLNSSKIQYLGNSRPKDYYEGYANGIYESFVYTPCTVDELHGDDTCQSSSS
ncbi:hypothetical protein ACP70R_012008 [Stipagrostis hirtigluma subsp. patula]